MASLPDTTDASVVEAILGEAGQQLPTELRLLMHGDDFDTWNVADSMIVKFARADEIADKVERECRVTTLLRQRLGDLVPAIVCASEPVSSFPYPFLGWEPARGVQSQSPKGKFSVAPDSLSPALAGQLGSAIEAIHAIPVMTAAAHGVDGEISWRDRRTELSSAAVDRTRLVVGDAVDRFLDQSPPADSVRPVPCHADLKGEHIFLSPASDRVTSLIDWADIAVTDPARDIAGVVLCWGASFARAVGRAAREPAGTADRAVFLARDGLLRYVDAVVRGEEMYSPVIEPQLRVAFAEE